MAEKMRGWLILTLPLVATALGFTLVKSPSTVGPPTHAGSGWGTAAPEVSAQGTGTTVAGVELAPRGRPYRGPKDAPVTIVEFTDYHCPFCRHHFDQTLPLILENYGDRVKYVVRNLPLVQIHPTARRTAEAAECALDQDRFWEYHDLLFQNPRALDENSLKRYARDLGLDPRSFDACLESRAKSSVVARDLRDAARLGLGGTPSFFINGRILIGAQPYPAFEAYIEDALQNAKGR